MKRSRTSSEPLFLLEPYERADEPVEEGWETTTRPSGEKPTDEPGWTPWEPLGVSPVVCTFRRAGVVWRRRRINPERTTGFALAGTLLGLVLIAATGTRPKRKHKR
jgi:hypothetical protein